jgi:hypothetical protein
VEHGPIQREEAIPLGRLADAKAVKPNSAMTLRGCLMILVTFLMMCTLIVDACQCFRVIRFDSVFRVGIFQLLLLILLVWCL